MKITIQKATKDMLPGLTEVWRACFNDDAAYIAFFYACNFLRIETYAALDEERAVGMLHLIPASIDGRLAYYGYAMGMLPEYRGTGIFPELHRTVFSLMRERNAAYFLKPANARLAEYYAGQGMAEGFYLKKAEYAADYKKLKKTDIRTDDISADEYLIMRDSYFNRKGYVRWDKAAVAYAVTENLRSGGFIKKVSLEEGEFAVFGALSDDAVIFRETTLTGAALDKNGGVLAAHFGAARLEAELPVFSEVSGGRLIPAGMIYNMDKEEEGYFNLPLD